MSSINESGGASVAARAPALDFHEIQATVLRPRPAPYFGAHVLLRIDDARSGRELIRRLAPHIASATNWWNAKTAWLEMGISYAGMEALGLPKESLQSFPEAFRVGMAARASQLGDDGVNDPKHWDASYRSGEVHIGVSAFCDSEEKRQRALAIAREQYEGFKGVTVLHLQDFGAQPFLHGTLRESFAMTRRRGRAPSSRRN